uniref:Uncharacterized protein n=1 Tax=Monodon monoceros TaxID=40151 RepID=A0A8C6FA20_MONMO
MYRKINSVRLAQFGGQFFGLCLFQLGDANSILCECATYLIVSVVVIGPDGFHQLSQSTFVFPNKAEGKMGVIGLSVTLPEGSSDSLFSSNTNLLPQTT